ncbi:DNA-directed RNA polymerase subunit delta [Natribacillus halophilus]|uniref:Probable DNA-directed RNA polymerase subunit delta n=2 Tax=Natribacillus halophilus TaxID=549003 RepID=A0A1G8KVS3_9BACI|nr:DNA-directed RNA polymerase subunit delta [Natribacillus halophilus]
MTMSELKREQVEEMSAVELAYRVLKEKGEPVHYKDLFSKIAQVKEIETDQLDDRRAKLFTDLNIGGSFVHLGANHWGLKAWYPVDQSEEDLSRTIQAPTQNTESEDNTEGTDDDLEDIEDELDALANEDDAESNENNEFDGFDSDEDVENEEAEDDEG